MKKLIQIFLLLVLCVNIGSGQSNNISATLEKQELKYNYQQQEAFITKLPTTSLSSKIRSEVSDGALYEVNKSELVHIFKTRPALLSFSFVDMNGESIKLNLYKAKVLSDDFELFFASDRTTPAEFTPPVFYRGVMIGEEKSVISLVFLENEMSGVLSYGGENYNFGPLEFDKQKYILYKESDLKNKPEFNCTTAENAILPSLKNSKSNINALPVDNCVRLYAEVDYDIYSDKRSNTESYMMGLLSEVFTLYDNESITMYLQEMLIWDEEDVYVGTNNNDLLKKFVNELNGNFDGDIAKLIGSKSSGGLAYVNTLCNKKYALGYSDINSSYKEVPEYSLSVMVLAHEMGHILGSNHTHDCVWGPNNNEAIDRCGPEYSSKIEDCDPNAPIPYQDGGTIMSYCHLLGNVGINFNNGFGSEPGDLIRSRVQGAYCLESCSMQNDIIDVGVSEIISPKSNFCGESVKPSVSLTNYGDVTLTQVEIHFEITGGDETFLNWTGNLAKNQTVTVELPEITLPKGSIAVKSYSKKPNNINDSNNANDESTSSVFVKYPETYYTDGDNDGYGDPESTLYQCSQPIGYVDNDEDCDDRNAQVHPNAQEICNSIDDDCNGQIDENLDKIWYFDGDNDSYGDPESTLYQCSQPIGYVDNDEDCDDRNAQVHPNAQEICNSIDDDCNGQIDENLDKIWYFDGDNDSYGDPESTLYQCSQPIGYVDNDEDCDDRNAQVHPNAQEICNSIDDDCNGQIDENLDKIWYFDGDNDSYGDPESTLYQCSQPIGYVDNDEDCDDRNAQVHPNAQEICNSIDDDCNGQIDENLDKIWYFDGDNDGYGDPESTLYQCSQPEGYVENNSDCNDENNLINPGSTELCDNIDNNCNEKVDENTSNTTWYADNDGDGYGDPNKTKVDCNKPEGYVENNSDCNDENNLINPGSTELCDNIDNNCNGKVDENTSNTTWYADNDGDGYGDPNKTKVDCKQPEGYVEKSGDCNDENNLINPGSTELCDNIDNNCNEKVDENTSNTTWYADNDGDGYGDPNKTKVDCKQPEGYVENNSDCNDENNLINPGSTELCDNIDNNCNEKVDENTSNTTWYADNDGDGYGDPNKTKVDCKQPEGYVENNSDCNDENNLINPGSTELCDNIDNNCNGKVDENTSNTTWYADNDGDGYGDPNKTKVDCKQPEGYVEKSGDCNDTNPNISPDSREVCDAINNDCDNEIDEITFTTPEVEEHIIMCYDETELEYCVNVTSEITVKWIHGSDTSSGVCVDLTPGDWSVEFTEIETNCVVKHDFEVTYTTLDITIDPEDTSTIVTGGKKPYRDTIITFEENFIIARVTDNNDCTVTDSALVSNVFSTINSEKIDVFPNPTSNEIYIQSKLTSTFNVEVISVTGKILNQCENCNTIRLHSLADGVYYLHISDPKGTFQIMKPVIKF